MASKNHRLGLLVVLLALTIVLFITSRRQAAPAETADLVLMNGRIVTVDARFPEAAWLAVRGDRITAVGAKPDGFRPHVGRGTKVIDLAGALAVPGLIESHGHFMGLGQSKTILDLTKARSWDEIVALVGEAAKAAKPGEWIQGRGWHQEKWDRAPSPAVDGLPLHDALSRVTPGNPVILTHASGHSALANAKAMEISGIAGATKDPDGGTIVRDAKGEPIGAFLENAMGLLRHRDQPSTPAEAEAQSRRLVELAAKECLARGVTTFHDAGASFGTIDLYKKMAEEGALPVRLYVMLSAGSQALISRGPASKMIGAADNHLTVRAIKRLIDGAHTAWLLEPYRDAPPGDGHPTGLNTESIEEMKATAAFAVENGFQLATHAIGDRANRETLDIYEAAFKAHPDKTGLRWRIEHAQHIDPADISRFARLGVVPAMQAIHCTSDAPYVLKRLGEKRAADGAYVWRKLMDAGAIIANGTDVPVEAVDPMANFYAAVTRKLKDGTTFFPDQRMSREEALRCYTANGAYAAFEESLKGSLSPGKLADITVLTRDILICPEEEIPGTEVLYTIVGGRILYRR